MKMRREILLSAIVGALVILGLFLRPAKDLPEVSAKIPEDKPAGTVQPPEPPGPEGGFCYQTFFNPATVSDVEGKVASIVKNPAFPPVMRMELDTGGGSVSVLLSPSWYLKEKQFPIQKGESIVVRGSRMQYGKDEIIVAEKFTRNGESLSVRTPQGEILWKGGEACEPQKQ